MSQTNPLEILFVSHKYPPSTGGMEKQSFELISTVSSYAKVHQLVYIKGQESLLKFFFHLNRNILKILKKNPAIQIVHFNDGLIASISSFHKGYDHLKRVATVHGLDVVFPLPYFQKRILKRFNRFDHIIAVSQATADAAISRGIQREKVSCINNGVDPQIAFKQNLSWETLSKRYPFLENNKSYMVTLGRPVKRKGFSWLLKKVIPHLPADFQLLMIGPFHHEASFIEKLLRFLPYKLYHLITLFLGYPSDEREIRKILTTSSVRGQKVRHLGKIPFEDLKALLSNAKAFLMPNISVAGDMEGFGLVCLEASLAGTLVLASGIEGITDAIHDNKNGILLPSEDSKAWINQIQQVMAEPDYYQQLAENFQSYSALHFGWEKMGLAYLELFEKIANSPSFYTLNKDNSITLNNNLQHPSGDSSILV